MPGPAQDARIAVEMHPRNASIMADHRIYRQVRRLYVRYVRPHIRREITGQRLKLAWFIWGYWPLFTIRNVSIWNKLRLFSRFVVIDWHVVHGHEPSDIALVCKALAERRSRRGEALLEAGCFNGGSSAKFSLICALLGYELCVYDSFEGVEPMSAEAKRDSYDFSGEYAAAEESVRANVAAYGEPSVCSFVKGWFSDTLAKGGVGHGVRVAYIDCDVAKGTREALQGIVPALVDGGCIFSEDFYLTPVVSLLVDPSTWRGLGRDLPTITRVGRKIALIRFDHAPALAGP
jgi:O-methyltransferase